LFELWLLQEHGGTSVFKTIMLYPSNARDARLLWIPHGVADKYEKSECYRWFRFLQKLRKVNWFVRWWYFEFLLGFIRKLLRLPMNHQLLVMYLLETFKLEYHLDNTRDIAGMFELFLISY